MVKDGEVYGESQDGEVKEEELFGQSQVE